MARIFLDNGAKVSAANLFGDTPLVLVSDKNANNPMVKLLIKGLTLQKIDQPTIELKDERFMEEYPDLWDYYQDCIEHAYRTKFTKFAKNCTFMQLLLQCPCDIATLMRDKCFESNFDMSDLYSFGMYTEDLIRAYERAQNFSCSMLQLEKTINTIFQHFVDYNVVWKGVRYLSKCYCRKMTHRELVPLLDCAVVRNHVELTEMFLQNGADVNVRIVHQAAATPLLLALERHNANVQAPMLLKYGAKVWAKDKFGLNALHYVAFLRGTVNLFADHGADVNSRANESPEDDTFPLYLAAVEALLKRGANVNMKTKTGRTALHKACQLRLSQSINVVEDNLGKTPFALFTRTSIRAPAKRPITDMIKALAKRKACQPQIEVKDEEIMKTYNQRLWNSYHRCIEEVHKTRSTRIVESCTFFQLLTKDSPQIATLMRNPEFEVNFQLYDLQSEFPMFAEDITKYATL
ncbi:uncharacterized protein LOC107980630 [Nasonia vitripennis]|uniref:Uncharacterized protein n=1 Tax=Nasonia vitripennis TaxID=7425 RepID=A0A7M7M643_NASVI|nr:uncharacterized protein LOC107980630 [Nasonia vitripennis]